MQLPLDRLTAVSPHPSDLPSVEQPLAGHAKPPQSENDSQCAVELEKLTG